MADYNRRPAAIDELAIPDGMKADLNGKGLLTAGGLLEAMFMSQDVFAPYCAKFGTTYDAVVAEISKHVPEEDIQQIRRDTAQVPPGRCGAFARDRTKERKIIRRRDA